MILVFFIIYKFNLGAIFSSIDTARNFINSFGIYGPIVLIILIIISVILLMLPTTIFVMVAGFLYGPLIGTTCSVIGILIGSSIVFFMSQKYGRPFVEHHVHKKDLQHFDIMFKKMGTPAFFISRLIPIIPNNVVNMAMGLTKISFKSFFWLSFIGYIPETIVYCMFGEQLLSGHLDHRLLIFVSIALVFFFIYLFRHQLRIFFVKEIKEFEEEIKKEEKILIKDVEKIEEKIKNIEKKALRKKR